MCCGVSPVLYTRNALTFESDTDGLDVVLYTIVQGQVLYIERQRRVAAGAAGGCFCLVI